MNIAYLCTGIAQNIIAEIIKKTRSNEKRRKAFNADFGQDGILHGSQRTAAVAVIHDGSKNLVRESPHPSWDTARIMLRAPGVAVAEVHLAPYWLRKQRKCAL